MTTRIAINGFGRIGRLTLRALMESGRTDLRVVAINSTADITASAHLLNFDSVHGRYPGSIETHDGGLDLGNGLIHVLNTRSFQDLPWAEHGVDIVIDCTGVCKDGDIAASHLASGADGVLISAPAHNVDISIVYGINHTQLQRRHRLVSAASCTTNALAPVARVLHDAFHIENGFATTIHAFTSDQNLLDNRHSGNDHRRARAATLSLVPTKTGAAKALGTIIPELAGKIDAAAIRAPIANVSVIDLKVWCRHRASIPEICNAFATAAAGPLNKVLTLTTLPLVSSDFNHDTASAVIDISETRILDNRLFRILAWYDNEWGYANRLLDVAATMGALRSEPS